MDLTSFLHTFALYLGLAIVLEVGCALFVGIRNINKLMIIALVQVVTNPPVNLIALYIMMHDYHTWPIWTWHIPLEIIVFIIEGAIYKKYLNISRPFSFSLTANYFSYSFPIICTYFMQ